MKQKINTWWKAIFGGILTLLGFTACDDFGIIRCEYGMPHANYKLLGDVKDAKGTPLKGICVVFVPRGDDTEESWENDTLYTDAKGHFEVASAHYSWPGNHEDFLFVAEDVNGAEDGSYLRQKVSGDDIKVSQVKDGDGNWYNGDYEVSTTITMQESGK